jgi:hypothetical protein
MRSDFVFSCLRRFACLAACVLLLTATAYAVNPIQTENAKAGTTSWKLTNPATSREIEGYASLTSVNRGGQISLFVNTAAPSYTIEIFRMGWYGGAGARQVLSAVTRTGTQQPIPTPDSSQAGLIECRWTNPYLLTIPNTADPTDWASGVYLAKLTASTGKQSYILFVVRDDARVSDYLFQSSVTTFQAYNNWGGKSLYNWNSTNGPAQKVSFNRPYAIGNNQTAAAYVGAGEFIANVQPAYETSSAGWEYNMVRWLEREGYDVTYCTSVDTHANANLLLSHKAFLSVGHDEYWSWQMRTNVEAARDRGVNLGFFSSNTCYWQIRFETSQPTGAPNRTVVAYKDLANLDPLDNDGDPTNNYLITTKWRDAPVNRSEDSMIGVMYETDPVDVDLVITNAAHWVCAGTGLQNGDHLQGLVGYEVDHISTNSPVGIQGIAHSPYIYSGATRYADMTVYTAASGATVFATGSMQWSWGLDDFNSSDLRPSRLNTAAQQMTRNVLARFVGAQPPPPTPTPTPTPTTGLSDDFNDNTRDTAKWNLGTLNEPSASFDSQVSVLEQNQRLEITPLAALTGQHFNGYVSAATWNLTNSRASVEVVQTAVNSANTVFAIGTDSNNWYRFVIEDGQIYFQEKINGAKTSTNITYDAVQHRFWRFRHDQAADQLVFETSADGTVWTTRRSVARQLTLTAVRVELGAGTWGYVSAPGKAIFDNFMLVSNSPPPPPPPGNTPPVAKPGGPYNATTAQAIQFNGSGSSDADGTITAYQWNFGDSTTGTGVTPTHAYSSPGTYTVTLTVTDNKGATNSASTTATITAPVTLPAAPTNLTADSFNKGQATLRWTDRSNNEQSFRIERSTSSSSGFVEIATVGANVTSYTNTGLTHDRRYYYRVRARNTAGNSAYSNIDSAVIK